MSEPEKVKVEKPREFYPFSCRIRFHDWNKWDQASQVEMSSWNNYLHSREKFYVWRQHRSCKGCGKTEIRQIKVENA